VEETLGVAAMSTAVRPFNALKEQSAAYSIDHQERHRMGTRTRLRQTGIAQTETNRQNTETTMNLPQPNNGNIPVIGQKPQASILHSAVEITPDLLKILEAWSKRTGIPFSELGHTIWRIGLISVSAHIEMPITSEEAIKAIPLTPNEEKARFN
jgi:hypothetical protein